MNTKRAPSPERTEKIVQAVADTILSGKAIATSPTLIEARISTADRAALARIANTTVEKFNSELNDLLKLASLKIGTRIINETDELPRHSLGFTLAVMEDKRARLEGNAARSHASLTQINVFNDAGTGLSKAELIAQLSGKRPMKSANPPPSDSPAPAANPPPQPTPEAPPSPAPPP